MPPMGYGWRIQDEHNATDRYAAGETIHPRRRGAKPPGRMRRVPPIRQTDQKRTENNAPPAFGSGGDCRIPELAGLPSGVRALRPDRPNGLLAGVIFWHIHS